MRTTLDLDTTVLRELKDRGRREGKSLGVVASELLARALAVPAVADDEAFDWVAEPMQVRVDLADKDALYRVLDSA